MICAANVTRASKTSWYRYCQACAGTPEPGRCAPVAPTLLRLGVPPLASTADGVATWPETATAVAVHLTEDGRLAIVAPCGLSDLLDGVCRRNPRRVSVEEYCRRVHTKRIAEPALCWHPVPSMPTASRPIGIVARSPP